MPFLVQSKVNWKFIGIAAALMFILFVGFLIWNKAEEPLLPEPLPEKIEKVTIVTDKTEYLSGEAVKIVVENIHTHPVEIFTYYRAETLLRGNWFWIKDACDCPRTYCEAEIPLVLQPGETHETAWFQKEAACNDEPAYEPVSTGRYRIRFYYLESREVYGDIFTEEITGFSFSNEFTIKEINKDRTSWVYKQITQCAEEWQEWVYEKNKDEYRQDWEENKDYNVSLKKDGIKQFYQERGISVLDIRYEKELDPGEFCEACDCLSGATLHFLVLDADKNYFLELDFKALD